MSTRKRYSDSENEALVNLVHDYPLLNQQELVAMAINRGLVKGHSNDSVRVQMSRLIRKVKEDSLDHELIEEIRMPEEKVLPVVPEDFDLKIKYDALMAEHLKLKARMDDLKHSVFDHAIVFEDKYGNKQIKLDFRDIIHAVRRVWSVDYYMKITSEQK